MFLTFITRITTIIDDWYYNISLYNVNIYIRRQQIKDWFLRHTYDSTHTHTHTNPILNKMNNLLNAVKIQIVRN